jgi:hypothetical protein
MRGLLGSTPIGGAGVRDGRSTSGLKRGGKYDGAIVAGSFAAKGPALTAGKVSSATQSASPDEDADGPRSRRCGFHRRCN